jgi:ESF2/ABP1 family protein
MQGRPTLSFLSRDRERSTRWCLACAFAVYHQPRNYVTAMPAEKRNNFLDADESDEDVRGYDSEEDIRKGAKRRKIEDRDEEHDDFSDDGDDRVDVDDDEEDEGVNLDLLCDEEDEDGEEEEDDNEGGKSTRKPKLLELQDESKPLTRKNLVATEAAIKKSGVIYISRVPPCTCAAEK